jgi:hypothetical protein
MSGEVKAAMRNDQVPNASRSGFPIVIDLSPRALPSNGALRACRCPCPAATQGAMGVAKRDRALA